MKRFLVLIITLMFLGLSVFALADDSRCLLTGNTYSFEVDNVKYELSGFDCTFGPGCQAECDLWYGDFATGPLYHEVLPFHCYTDGSVMIAGLPCGLTLNGDLECLIVNTSDYTCYVLGDRTWCVPEDGVAINFEQD
jgi:hypothetical protein